MGERGLESERIADHRAIAQRNGEKIIADPAVALHAITHHQATFTLRDLAMFIHRHSDGKEQYDRAMSAVRSSPDMIALGKDGRGDDRFTSREMIETEQRLQRASELLAERAEHRTGAQDRAAALAHAEADGLVLKGEQRAAFEHVTGAGGLSVVVGYAGTGKSAMLGVVREAWERGGFAVRGAALSGIAAEGLENGSGIASRTIASLEHGWAQGRDLLTARDVLVIDEAGMAGTRQMERVLSLAADAGAKIVLIGDPQQLQAIEAGAAFRAIHERHGGVEITEVRRQDHDWQREATRHLATGRTGEAIHAYRDHGMVHAAETREQARGELVEQWDRERIAAPDQSRIILTHTNDEVRELNEAARDRMRASHALGDDVLVKTEHGASVFASGDRIMFLRNERSLEVKNGTLGTIEQVDKGHIAVRTDDGRAVAFDIKDYAHVDHGYAATIHKAQGMTVDRAHMLATPGMDRHGAYVGMSRHRDGMALHYGRDDFKDDARLIRLLSRERTKDMAGDYKRLDPIREFAERREITFGERIIEIARAGAEKARGIFDGLNLTLPGQQRQQRETPAPEQATPERPRGMFDGLALGRFVTAPTPTPERGAFAGFRPDPARQQHREHAAQQLRDNGVRAAVERYARALDAIRQTRAQGVEALPHQRVAFQQARDALDAIRPKGSTDLNSAFRNGPELIREAAQGRGQDAMRAMDREADIRRDPFQRADRFVEGWQQLRQQHDELVRDGNFRGAKTTAQHMADMAKSLERDAQLETVLGLRGRELSVEISADTSRNLGRDLADSIPRDAGHDHGRSFDRGMDR